MKLNRKIFVFKDLFFNIGERRLPLVKHQIASTNRTI